MNKGKGSTSVLIFIFFLILCFPNIVEAERIDYTKFLPKHIHGFNTIELPVKMDSPNVGAVSQYKKKNIVITVSLKGKRLHANQYLHDLVAGDKNYSFQKDILGWKAVSKHEMNSFQWKGVDFNSYTLSLSKKKLLLEIMIIYVYKTPKNELQIIAQKIASTTIAKLNDEFGYSTGLRVEGIIYSEDDPIAVVNGRTIRENETVKGAKVVEITQENVKFEKGKDIFWRRISGGTGQVSNIATSQDDNSKLLKENKTRPKAAKIQERCSYYEKAKEYFREADKYFDSYHYQKAYNYYQKAERQAQYALKRCSIKGLSDFIYNCRDHRYKIDEKRRKLSQKARAGKIMIGMTKSQVKTAWGDPYEINRDVGIWGVDEQWVYGAYKGVGDYKYFDPTTYVYFKDGIVTSWQD